MNAKRAIKILIVDTYPVGQAGIKAMLRAPDIRVVGAAKTGREAFRLMNKRPPNMVVISLRSDEPDRLDLVARIKKRRPKTSVVIVTRSKNTHYLARAIALGCSGYLHLTTGPREFKEAVRAVARGECAIDPHILRELLKEMAQRRSSQNSGLRARLTVPEQEVLQLITLGRKNRQIAEKLGCSIGTVKDYVQKIIQKLEVSDRTQAAVTAVRLGLIE